MRRPLLQRLILAIALFALIGGHRGVVQCVAWGMMIYERTAERSLTDALTSTFSGEEPCEICIALRESKKEKDKGSPVPIPAPKIDLAQVANDSFIPARRPILATYPESHFAFESPFPAAPVPPPPDRA